MHFLNIEPRLICAIDVATLLNVLVTDLLWRSILIASPLLRMRAGRAGPAES